MMDMVYAGQEELIGEVVGVEDELTTVQVYEDTAGLAPGQPVKSTGAPMSLLLGPGLLGNIFDGIGRPLRNLEAISGPFLGRGVNIPTLDSEKKWDVTLAVKEGDAVTPGMLYAQCRETAAIIHRWPGARGAEGYGDQGGGGRRLHRGRGAGGSDRRAGQGDPAEAGLPLPHPGRPAHPPPSAHHPAADHRPADHRHPSSPSAKGAPPPSPGPSARARP